MNRQNITSADDKSIGFDYQFYHFFYALLDLRHGEKVGIEVKDDVHIDLANGTTILIQAKHTLQQTKDGNSINLTERDKDLWKTLSNWTKLILEQDNPEDFIKNTKFQLVTNKGMSNNPFLQQVEKFRESEIKSKDFKDYLKKLATNTKDADIIQYINDFSGLNASQLKEFSKQLDFNLNQDNLIEKIKTRLLEKIYIKERVDDVYKSLHSELRDNNYLTIKKGTKIEISFEDFMKRYRNCFKLGMPSKLPIREFDFTIPDNPEKQKFIRQLIDIKDIDADEKELVVEYSTQMLQLFNNLKSWEENGDLLPTERKKFNKETILIWKNSFRAKYRKIKQLLDEGTEMNSLESEIKDIAVSVLDEMRKQILTIDETALTTELSNGQFYLLTEDKILGWHYDWEHRYK